MNIYINTYYVSNARRHFILFPLINISALTHIHIHMFYDVNVCTSVCSAVRTCIMTHEYTYNVSTF